MAYGKTGLNHVYPDHSVKKKANEKLLAISNKNEMFHKSGSETFLK